MEFTREIYWNVGHGAATLVPMYLLVIIALAVLVYGFRQRITVYRQGLPLDRTDHLGERVVEMLKNVLLQTKVTRVPRLTPPSNGSFSTVAATRSKWRLGRR